jgi:hypothetical protein
MTRTLFASLGRGALALTLVLLAGHPLSGQQQPRPASEPPADLSQPLGPVLPADAIPLGTPTGPFFEPSLTATQSYDDNVFLDPERPTADFFTRITPGLQAGVRTRRMMFVGTAQFDAERYNEQDELDALQARRFVALDVNGLVTPRLALLANFNHAFTTTPSELNLLSGLVLGRADATRYGGRGSVIYQSSPRGRLSAGYNVAHDELTGFTSVLTQEATAEYRHAVSQRLFLSTDYTLRSFEFDDPLPQHPAHVFGFGVGYAINPTTSLTVRGGPRFSRISSRETVTVPRPLARVTDERSIDPEWSLQLQRRGRRGDAELTFARSQTTALGQNLVIDTVSVGASIRVQPASRVELRVSPAFYRDTGGVLEARVFRAAAELVIWLGNHVALVSQFSGSYQDNTRPPALAGPDILTTVRQNVVSLGLRASARRRVPPREPGSAASSYPGSSR